MLDPSPISEDGDIFNYFTPPVSQKQFEELYTLYKCYGRKDKLLYVGQTIRPHHRFSEHKKSKSWWRKVVKIKIRHYKDLAALRLAEKRAILKEKPLYNTRLA